VKTLYPVTGGPLYVSDSHAAVLEAMTRLDPGQPTVLDSPAEAIRRRLPHIGTARAVEILRDLNALGLTNVPYSEGMVSITATADLTRWITEEGWRALGLGTAGVLEQ
jgi:hypothetical protein